MMDDLISRQAVIEEIEKYFGGLPIQGRYDILEIIRNLPYTQQMSTLYDLGYDLGCVLWCLGEKIPACCDGKCIVCRYSVRGVHFIKNGKVYYLDGVYHCAIGERSKYE